MGTRHLVIIGVVGVGALTAGSAAAAIGDGGPEEPVIVETTTTVLDETTTTVESTTTTTAVDETTTTVEATTTVPTPAPDPVEGDDVERGPDPNGPAKHGLCRAFSGRSGQPGSSQAYANLFEAAGGDIDAFCAEVLSSPDSDDHADDDEADDHADDDADDDESPAGDDAARGGHGRPDHPGNGGKGGKGKPAEGR